MVFDNTWLQVERAYLLCNTQLTKAPLGQLHESEKGTIELQEIDLTFNTFVVTNANVNAAAAKYWNSYIEKYSLISNDFNYNAQTEILNKAAKGSSEWKISDDATGPSQIIAKTDGTNGVTAV